METRETFSCQGPSSFLILFLFVHSGSGKNFVIVLSLSFLPPVAAAAAQLSLRTEPHL